MGSSREVLCLAALVLVAGGMAAPPRTPSSRPPGSPSTGPVLPAAVAPALVFDGVTVVDVEHGKLVSAQRVVIVGNRIQAVGGVGAVRMPKGAQVVDARGKYLIPGLWDMHVHPDRSTDVFYPLFLANGVTGIRNPSSPVPLDTLIQWRREIVAGTRVGPPRQLLSGRSIDEVGFNTCQEAVQRHVHLCVSTPTHARHLIDSLKTAGADMIKPYTLSRAMYFVLAAEARRVGLPFGGHLNAPVTPLEASDSGARIIDHAFGGDTDVMPCALRARQCQVRGLLTFCWLRDSASVERCQPVAERFRRNDTWWVPTVRMGGMALTHGLPILARLTEHTSKFWAGELLPGNWLHDPAHVASPDSTSRRDSLGAMHIVQRVGLPILAGTDVMAGPLRRMSPGFALHAELAVYVAEGLTPLAALQSATLNPAKFLHGTDSLGTVAPGKLADLVLLDADPLADITNTTTIRAVVANGRYYDRAALDQVVAAARAAAKQPR